MLKEVIDVDGGAADHTLEREICVTGTSRNCYTGSSNTRNIGICRDGQQMCINGQWEPCANQKLPQTEICDGLDNNCDGEIDESCGCKIGQSEECYTGSLQTKGQGICKAGTRHCQPNLQWGPCVGEVLPQKEICDGIDNNCDGQVDEGCPSCQLGQKQACYTGPTHTRGKGACKDGHQICDATGKWGACTDQTLPSVEYCNGRDDDCDGTADNDCLACRVGDTTTCYPTVYPGCTNTPVGQKCVGICKMGTLHCIPPGKWDWSNCEGLVIPRPETCNGLDDDCNGKIDDNLVFPPCSNQKGVCAGSVKTCVADKGWIDCTPADYLRQNRAYEHGVEKSCDGLDNNCDGRVDENCSSGCTPGEKRDCFSGQDFNRKKGNCRDGVQTCGADRKWGTCVGEILPKTEICNGLDDDCDGYIDESFPEQSKTCKTGQPGICEAGYYHCLNGKVVCVPMYAPRVEICNGIDDDCNGKIDDGIPQHTYYRDADGDGFGDPKHTIKDCRQPPGYVSNADDCYDQNANVRPGQLNFFTQHRGDGSFDYNCDGQEQKRYTQPGSCHDCKSAVIDIGFLPPIPACGKTGQWVDLCRFDVGKCYPLTITKYQECR